jgi:hypothetical protein
VLREAARTRWKRLDPSGSVEVNGEGAVEIGDPERTYTVEPLEDPGPREPPEVPEEAPQPEPAEPEKLEAEWRRPTTSSQSSLGERGSSSPRKFDRSESQSMNGDIVHENARCTLYYMFRSEKRTFDREGNPPSRGGAKLRIARRPAVRLEGDYWREAEDSGADRDRRP